LAFCTVSDLEALLGLSAADPAAAELAIRDVTDAIKGLVGQPLEAEVDRVVTMTALPYSPTIHLPVSNVVAIDSIVEAGTELDVDDDYYWRPSGVVTRVGRYWDYTVNGIVVTFTCGYGVDSVEMNYLRAIASSAALRRYQNALRSAAAAGASGIQSESMPDYQVSFGVDLGGAYSMLLLPSEREMILRRFSKGVG
jgi:hypothetical protein